MHGGVASAESKAGGGRATIAREHPSAGSSLTALGSATGSLPVALHFSVRILRRAPLVKQCRPQFLHAASHQGVDEPRGPVRARRAGELLVEAREQMAPFQWGTWLSKNFTLSKRTAQDYMLLAQWLEEMPGSEHRGAHSVRGITRPDDSARLHDTCAVDRNRAGDCSPHPSRSSRTTIWWSPRSGASACDPRLGAVVENDEHGLAVLGPDAVQSHLVTAMHDGALASGRHRCAIWCL